MSGADIDSAWRKHSRGVLATLIRLLGDFELAEEALHDAFLAAANTWPRDGVPNNPFSWLVSAGRFRAIDALRRRVRFDAAAGELARRIEMEAQDAGEIEPDMIADDQLRLIFTCCHPELGREAQVALTLREVCGLTTEEIARAFITKPATLAQRIVRAKAKIRDDGIPYAVPDRAELAERLDAVLAVVYLVFNEGYAAHAGATLMRTDLSGEAVRLGRLLVSLLPDGEALGLLGLMLIHESRRGARVDDAGDLVLLADQDRLVWDKALIAEGQGLVEAAFATRQIGPYTLQAAIAAVHAQAATADKTDWAQIVSLYDVLLRAAPSPIVELNQAVAVGMAQGPEVGLKLIVGQLERGELDSYHLAHAAKADMLRRLGRNEAARDAYGTALDLCQLEPERRFLQKRIAEL